MPTQVSTTRPSSDQSTEDLELASALRIAVMRLSRRLRAESEISQESVTLTQLSALSSVMHHGPLSPTALAERERVQPPSMTRVIAALEARGLVKREPHPSDRRQSVIATTKAGEALVIADRERRQAWLSGILSTLNEEEREILRAASSIIERVGQT